MDLVYFNRPSDGNWSISRHQNFCADLDMDTGLREDMSLGKVFAGWHNLEVFAFPVARCPQSCLPL